MKEEEAGIDKASFLGCKGSGLSGQSSECQNC